MLALTGLRVSCDGLGSRLWLEPIKIVRIGCAARPSGHIEKLHVVQRILGASAGRSCSEGPVGPVRCLRLFVSHP
jgi:hypothetical protein